MNTTDITPRDASISSPQSPENTGVAEENALFLGLLYYHTFGRIEQRDAWSLVS
jgi:hypothetical protein